MSKLGGEDPSPPLSIAPQVIPEGLFMTMPVLGHPFFEESYWPLSNQSSSQGQTRWSKHKQWQCPCSGDKLCLLSRLGSQVFSHSLSHGGLQLLKQGRAFPKNDGPVKGYSTGAWLWLSVSWNSRQRKRTIESCCPVDSQNSFSSTLGVRLWSTLSAKPKTVTVGSLFPLSKIALYHWPQVGVVRGPPVGPSSPITRGYNKKVSPVAPENPTPSIAATMRAATGSILRFHRAPKL